MTKKCPSVEAIRAGEAKPQVGDRVNWRRHPREGYCCEEIVAGIVEKIGAKRIGIVVAVRGFGCGQWERVTRYVDPASLSPRQKACQPLGESE